MNSIKKIYILKHPFYLFLGLLVLYFLLFHELVIGEKFGQHDFLKGYLLFSHVIEYLPSGVFPLWDPYSNGGQPGYPLISHQSINPLTLLLYTVVPNALERLDIVWNLYFLLGHLLFSLGSYLWLAQVVTKKEHAIVGFVVVLFSSLALSNFESPFLYKCWAFPWILFGFERLCKRDKRYVYFLSALLGMISFYFYSLYSIMGAALYFGAWLIYCFFRRKEISFKLHTFRYWLVPILVCVPLLVSAAGLSLVLLKDKKRLAVSHRYSEDLREVSRDDYEKFMKYSIFSKFGEKALGSDRAFAKPRDFVPLALPFLVMNEYSIFEWRHTSETTEIFFTMGTAAFLLMLFGLVNSRNKRKWVVFSTLTLIVMLALGGKTPLFPWLHRNLPYFSTIRYGHIFHALLFPLCAYFVVEGFSWVGRRQRFLNFSRNLGLLWLFSMLITTLYFVNLHWNPWRVLLGVGGLYLGVRICFRLIQRKVWRANARSFGTILFFVLLLEQLLVLGYHSKFFLIENTVGKTPTPIKTFLPQSRTSASDVNYSWPLASTGSLFLKEHLEMIPFGYFTLKNYLSLYKGTHLTKNQLHDISGVSAPMVRFYREFITDPGLLNDAKEASSIDFRTTALVSKQAYQEFQALDKETSGDPESTQILHRAFWINGASFQVETANPGILYYADGYDPYWTVTINGEPSQVLKVNLNYKGVLLPAGSHHVEFQYVHPSYMRFFAVHFLAIAVLALLFLLHWLRPIVVFASPKGEAIP